MTYYICTHAEIYHCKISIRRRRHPKIYFPITTVKISVIIFLVQVEKSDFIKAQENIVPASHRICVAPVKTLSSDIRPLLQDKLSRIMASLHTICPAEMITPDDS